MGPQRRARGRTSTCAPERHRRHSQDAALAELMAMERFNASSFPSALTIIGVGRHGVGSGPINHTVIKEMNACP